MPGINKFEGKDRRRVRRRNMMAKELAGRKYAQRVIPSRKGRGDTEQDTDGSHYWDYESDD